MPLYPNREELAYMAGIIDGEGSIYISKGRENRRKRTSNYYQPTIAICMTRMEAIDIFVKYFGGNLYFIKSDNDRRKDSYHWSLCSYEGCKTILKVIIPFLRLKKQQGELLLELICIREKIDTKRINNEGDTSYTDKQLRIVDEIKKLNKKGK